MVSKEGWAMYGLAEQKKKKKKRGPQNGILTNRLSSKGGGKNRWSVEEGKEKRGGARREWRWPFFLCPVFGGGEKKEGKKEKGVEDPDGRGKGEDAKENRREAFR